MNSRRNRRPPVAGPERYPGRMKTPEGLLREHTWFTEGITNESSRNAGTLGEGSLGRHGVDPAVRGPNVNWIAGLSGQGSPPP